MRSLLQISFFTFSVVCSAVSARADLASAKHAYAAKDYLTAYKEFGPLAEQGDADAQAMLGRMYLMGQGVQKDSEQASKWFKASASQGNAEAQFFLGSIYLLPRKDVAEGLKWLRLAADQGNQDAQLLLGKAYMDGSPEVPRDPVQGDMWLRLAAKDNLEFYQSQLAAAEKTMSADQIAKGKALAEAWRAKSGLKPE